MGDQGSASLCYITVFLLGFCFWFWLFPVLRTPSWEADPTNGARCLPGFSSPELLTRVLLQTRMPLQHNHAHRFLISLLTCPLFAHNPTVPHCRNETTLGTWKNFPHPCGQLGPHSSSTVSFPAGQTPSILVQHQFLFKTPQASEVPACLAASPGQVMTHSHCTEKGSNIASGDLMIYGASVYLESLQRKMTKEHELWWVIFSSLLPFTSYTSLEMLTSLSLGFLICKLGILSLLHSSWRTQ